MREKYDVTIIGGGDWNLCCGIKGDLCYKNTVACDDFKEKEKND